MTDPVQHQVEAYNSRDVDAFMQSYTADVRVEDGGGETILDGSEDMRTFYEALFSNSPELNCQIVNRTSVGDWVIDEEHVSGLKMEGFPGEAHAVVAYRVTDGMISFVRMFM